MHKKTIDDFFKGYVGPENMCLLLCFLGVLRSKKIISHDDYQETLSNYFQAKFECDKFLLSYDKLLGETLKKAAEGIKDIEGALSKYLHKDVNPNTEAQKLKDSATQIAKLLGPNEDIASFLIESAMNNIVKTRKEVQKSLSNFD